MCVSPEQLLFDVGTWDSTGTRIIQQEAHTIFI